MVEVWRKESFLRDCPTDVYQKSAGLVFMLEVRKALLICGLQFLGKK